ncbi:MAG: TonB-dependent receptor [Gemmatimonadetes bacterium]|nr:TonB-dependent receptor [Gemmatimonadota bacterium]
MTGGKAAGAFLIGALASAAPWSPLAAQDTTAVDTVEIRGIVIEVPRPATTTGGTSAVELSLDSLSVVAASTAEELLRRMPTIQMRVNSRGESQPDLRGAEERQIAFLLDGIPITLGWDHRTDASVIPITSVRKLTLLRGLSSMLHGPNVLGGAVEFDVVRGAYAQARPMPFGGSISLDQEGAVRLSTTATAHRVADGAAWTVKGGVGYRDSPGASLPGGASEHPGLRYDFLGDNQGRRLNSDQRLVDGFAAARFQRDDGIWVSGMVSTSSASRGVAPEAHVEDPRLWRYPEQNRLFLTGSGGTGRRENRYGESQVEANFGLDRGYTEISEFESAAYQHVVDGETGTTTTLTGRFLADHIFSGGVELRSALTLADVSHDEVFMAGPTFEYEQRLWSLGGELEIASRGPLGLGSDGTRWTVGGSLDGSDTPKSGDKPPLGRLWDWGMRAGVTRPGAGGRMLYHAGVSRRTRFPSLRELYSGALGRFQPNPDLQPESLVTAEAGVTLNAGASQVQVVAFHQRLTDAIVRTSAITVEGVRFQRVNRDEVRSTGLEVVVAGRNGPVDYGGSMTWKHVRVLDPRESGMVEHAEYQPDLSGTANLGVVGPRAITFTGFATYRGVQYCRNVEVRGLERMDPSATVEVEASKAFSLGRPGSGHFATATIGVANLTDSMVLDQCGLPQPGRTLRIQFTIR